MKIIEYKIIRDEKRHPKLLASHEYNWDGENLNSYDNIVDMMNACFHMNKLNEEYGYILALDDRLNFLGVFEVGHGTIRELHINVKEIYTFLLLVGAEQCIFFHNHPDGSLEISNGDDDFTRSINAFGGILDINMLESIIISRDGYTLIQEKHLEEFRKIFKKGR